MQGNESLLESSWSHGQMAAMPICGKNLSNIFSGTSGPISMKLEMLHFGLLPFFFQMMTLG